jgi:chromosome segregation ATPase
MNRDNAEDVALDEVKQAIKRLDAAHADLASTTTRRAVASQAWDQAQAHLHRASADESRARDEIAEARLAGRQRVQGGTMTEIKQLKRDVIAARAALADLNWATQHDRRSYCDAIVKVARLEEALVDAVLAEPEPLKP